MRDKNSRLGLIMSGGGARGAYEAGVIHYIRTALPEPFCHLNFPIQCGSSVGAINIAYLASTAHEPKYQGEKLYSIWSNLKQEEVYYRNLKALGSLVSNALLGFSRNLIGINPFGKKGEYHFKSIFNTAPFAKFLSHTVNWNQISKNVASGRLKVVALVATKMRTGKTELFVQKTPAYKYTGPYAVHEVDLNLHHAMASAAIPFIFPSINIDHHHYVDGGVRLNTPLSPAVQFGANKLIILSLHCDRQDSITKDLQIHPEKDEMNPSMGEYLGKMLNGFFLDRLHYDLEQMARINQIIARSKSIFGEDYTEKINEGLTRKLKSGKIVKKNFRIIQYLQINPSTPISDIFSDWFTNRRHGKPHFTALENFLLRALDINQDSSLDLLSYLTFAGDYIKMLLDLGYQDAKAKHDEIIDFLEKDPE